MDQQSSKIFTSRVEWEDSVTKLQVVHIEIAGRKLLITLELRFGGGVKECVEHISIETRH